MYTIAQVATDIIAEVDDSVNAPSQIQVETWVRSNAGYIANITNTNIDLVDSEYSIDIDDELKSVITIAYLDKYYRKLSTNSLANAFGQIVSLKDAETSVTFANASEIAKTYQNLSREWAEKLKNISSHYKKLKSITAEIL